jgi:hypothetical protein
MDWPEHYDACRLVEGKPGDGRYRALQAARRRVAANMPADWQWLAEALEDPEKKWFVANIFALQPLPKRLLHAFVRAAVYERDASRNQWFVEPCVRSYSATKVAELLFKYLENGTHAEKVGAAKAFYWFFVFSGTKVPVEDVTAVSERYQRATEGWWPPWR